MIDLSKIRHIYIAPGATDMRKSIDSCSALVSTIMYLDPFKEGDIFIFCNKRKNTLKILQYDGDGFWLHTKKLIGKNKFRWPKNKDECTSLLIDERQLKWLLEGIEINQKHAHNRVDPVVYY